MFELKVFSLGAVEGIPIGIYVALIAVFSIGTVLSLWQKGWREGLRYIALLLLAEWIFLVLCTCIFFRESGEECRVNLIPLISYFDYGENSYLMEKAALNILNVALFIPIGLLSGCGFRNITWQRVLTIGTLLSVFIEMLQLALKCGLCEMDDVIHNVAGCMVGVWVYWLLQNLQKYLINTILSYE